MTKYPDWIKVSCPTCNAKPYELCTSCLTLPKGITLRLPHGSRLIAYDQTIYKDEKAGDSRQNIPPGNNSNKTESHSNP